MDPTSPSYPTHEPTPSTDGVESTLEETSFLEEEEADTGKYLESTGETDLDEGRENEAHALPEGRPLHPKRQRILISRLSAHGDVVQTLPLLAALKRHHPNAIIGWLVEESAAPLLRNHPLIDQLHIAKRKTWLKNALRPWLWPQTILEIVDFVQELRGMNYDVSLDVQGLLKSAFWPFVARIPRRIGYKNTRELADKFYTETIPPHDLHDPRTPTVFKFMELGQPLGALAPREPVEFPLPPIPTESQERVRQWLSPLPAGMPRVVIAPSTIWDSKHWTETGWQGLLTELQALPIGLIFVGSPQDQSTLMKITQSVGPKWPRHWINLTGATQWTDMMALFQQTHVMLGLDSAPLHIANAMVHQPENVHTLPRIIGLYGPTAAGRTGPTHPSAKTLQASLSCQPCFERECPLATKDCMRLITPQAVIQLLYETLYELDASRIIDFSQSASLDALISATPSRPSGHSSTSPQPATPL